MALEYVDLEFKAKLETGNHNLNYLGPTLRGAFGYALKKTVCQVKSRTCNNCMLRSVCPYTKIFEGQPPQDRSIMTKYPAIPQPYILIVAPPGSWWGDSDELCWSIRLFSTSIDLAPYVINTFLEIGNTGIGSKRIPYYIDVVKDGTSKQILWKTGQSDLQKPTICELTTAKLPTTNTLRWTFETPLHIRSGGKHLQDIDGLSLILAGRRRWKLLNAFFSNNETEYNNIEVKESDNKHFDTFDFNTISANIISWHILRYSNRQKRKVRLEGVTGELIIEGPWNKVGNWLENINLIHLGKYVTFGLGRVRWEAI